MNVLYIANPSDNHDIKWISYFTEKKLVTAFLMPRKVQVIPPEFENQNPDIKLVEAISDFSMVRFYQTILTAIEIKKFIKKNEIRIIHILFAEPNALWCLFRRYFSVPIIVTCRGTDVLKTIPLTFQKKSLINFFVSSAYRRAFNIADFVTGTSQRQLDSIYEFSGRQAKTLVVRTGVEVTRLLADTSEFFPIEKNTPYILFPRYIKPLYNHEFCLDAITLFPPEVKAKYKMVFVGKDREAIELPYQELLERKMKLTTGVEFIFLPEVSQESIFELYKQAAVIVMTPVSDGSPVSAMEAIACGAKVILGPLQYDADIFGPWVYQLKSWKVEELSELIIHCLSDQRKVEINRYIPLVDNREEMNKIAKTYEQVLQ